MNPAHPEPSRGERARGQIRLPVLHRGEDHDERAFQIHRWTAAFVDRELEEQFERRRAPALHQRVWPMSLVATVLLGLLGLQELFGPHDASTAVLLLLVHLVMVCPLVVFAVRGRIRRDQVNQLAFAFTTTALVELWLFSWFLVHLGVHGEPEGVDLAVFCVGLLVVHLVVPNRLAFLTPITALASLGYVVSAVQLGDPSAAEVASTVTIIAIAWGVATFFHRDLEVSQRAEFIIVSQAEAYGERLEAAVNRARELEGELRRQANVDPLTSTGNRRWFFGQLELEFARAKRSHRPLAVLILDVDHFKKINDQHGHPVGDQVLKHLTTVARAALRTTDQLARIGGEEFAVLMPETTQRDAHDVAERVRHAIAANPVLIPSGAIRVTVSVGVTMCQTDSEAPTQALARADTALYDAKRSGRDLVIIR